MQDDEDVADDGEHAEDGRREVSRAVRDDEEHERGDQETDGEKAEEECGIAGEVVVWLSRTRCVVVVVVAVVVVLTIITSQWIEQEQPGVLAGMGE